jgi:hypothetical protein
MKRRTCLRAMLGSAAQAQAAASPIVLHVDPAVGAV